MNLLFNIINWYTTRFPFPHRGWKYFRSFLKKTGLTEKLYTKKLPDGVRIYVSPEDHIQQQLFWYGYYEQEAICIWKKLTQQQSIIVDVGANIGYYSLTAAKIATRGKIIAFEPLPSLQQKLATNIELNHYENVQVVNAALGDTSGQTELHVSTGDNIGMSGLKPQENFSGTTLVVEMISLDNWLAQENISQVDLVKIDTEGAELEVLRGMIKTLGNARSAVILEVMNELLGLFGHRAEDIYDLFHSAGYEAFEILPGCLVRPAPYGHTSYTMLFLPIGFQLPNGIMKVP